MLSPTGLHHTVNNSATFHMQLETMITLQNFISSMRKNTGFRGLKNATS